MLFGWTPKNMCILEKNHIFVNFVKRDSHVLVIWLNIKEDIRRKTFFLWILWNKIYNDFKSNETQKDSHGRKAIECKTVQYKNHTFKKEKKSRYMINIWWPFFLLRRKSWKWILWTLHHHQNYHIELPILRQSEKKLIMVFASFETDKLL